MATVAKWAAVLLFIVAMMVLADAALLGFALHLIVFMMILVDAVLLGLALYLIVRWRRIQQKQIIGRPLLVAGSRWSVVQRTLERLEVLGPALGFAGTVLGLVISFSEQGWPTFSAVAAVTFLGILMRVVAFSNDRLLEYEHLQYFVHGHADDKNGLR